MRSDWKSHQQRTTGRDGRGRARRVKPIDDCLTDEERAYIKKCRKKGLVPRLGEGRRW